jgi:hypothetical protein
MLARFWRHHGERDRPSSGICAGEVPWKLSQQHIPQYLLDPPTPRQHSPEIAAQRDARRCVRGVRGYEIVSPIALTLRAVSVRI